MALANSLYAGSLVHARLHHKGIWEVVSHQYSPYLQQRFTAHAWQRRRSDAAAHVPKAGLDDETHFGPRAPRRRKPEWVRIMEEDAEHDEDVAKVVDGTDGDPDAIRENIRRELGHKEWLESDGEGTDVPPRVIFRKLSAYGFWIWVEFAVAPRERERELLESTVKSWFTVGKLGGYNSQNLQVFYNADDDQSYFDYQNDGLEDTMSSYLHEMSEFEYRGTWARFRLDLGTADELSLDVLVNMLIGVSTDLVGLRSIALGGVNEDWPLPVGMEEEEENRIPEVGIDPLRLPKGMDEELELLGDLDDLGLTEALKSTKKLKAGSSASSSGASSSAPGYGSNTGQARTAVPPPPISLPAGFMNGRSKATQRGGLSGGSGSNVSGGNGGGSGGQAGNSSSGGGGEELPPPPKRAWGSSFGKGKGPGPAAF